MEPTPPKADTPPHTLPRMAQVVLQWVVLGVLVGLLCGVSSAAFLWLLDQATHVRLQHRWLPWLLPVAGLLLGRVFETLGKDIRGGNNLILDTIHDGGAHLPLRMTPMVLLGTVFTHLFGGSAGREGTAVQMGASLSDALGRALQVSPATRRHLLAAGVAGGFGSVFGTPLAGAVFALEVVVVGRLELGALLPALVASLVGDMTTQALGITHTAYVHPAALAMTPWLLVRWSLFAVGVAGASVLFMELTHGVKRVLEQRVPRLPLRTALGGAALVGVWLLSGTDDYLGLGVPFIERAFTDVTVPPWSAGAKILFTAITVGSGFIGGEVTPLFFVGAALGNTLAQWLDLPLALGAGVGLAAVFAACSNTPLALTLMCVELLGTGVLPHVLWVCVLAYVLTGHRSIYPSQRLWHPKHGGAHLDRPTRLKDLPPGHQ